MHGTSGQYRLDMKRDTPRTLMLKMDARLTFAGRERNAAVQLEGEREKKHIEYGRQLSQTEYKREERNVRKRMEFFQSLIEENKARRRTSMKDVTLFETELEADRMSSKRRWSKALPPLAVRRQPANLDLAENVGSVRRDQQAFSHNRAHERFLNRSLNELSNSYKKHATQKELNEEKLMKIREEMTTIGKPKPIPEESTLGQSSRNGLPKLTVSFGEPTRSNSRQQHPQMSLPELPSRNQTLFPKTDRKVSVSHNTLPGLSNNPYGARRISVAKNFYIDTSHSKAANRRRRDSIQLITLNNPNAKPKRDTRNRGLHLPSANTSLPSHFYDGIYEENPFLTPDFKPGASRVLLETTKSDNMYAWLGLDSEEELSSLRGGDVIGVSKEGTDEMEWLEIESTSDNQSIADEESKPTTVERPNLQRRTSSFMKRIYRIGGPEDDEKPKVNPLKNKFAKVARSIMIVRKLADSVGMIPEETDAKKEMHAVAENPDGQEEASEKAVELSESTEVAENGNEQKEATVVEKPSEL